MSNRNKNAFTKALQENNIQAQLISGSNPENIIAIVVSGYKFDKTTHMTKSAIQDLVKNIACVGVEKAYTEYVNDRQSVALQKINIAHGRTNMEILENQLGQQMTYADSFRNYQFKGKELKDCMIQLVNDTENKKDLYNNNLSYYKTWVKSVYNFYMDKDNKDWKNGKQIAESTIKRLLKEKQVRIIGEYIYSNKALCEFCRLWENANGKKIDRQGFVNKFIDTVNQEVGIG